MMLKTRLTLKPLNRIKKGGGVWEVLEQGLGAQISATSFSNATGTNAEFAN